MILIFLLNILKHPILDPIYLLIQILKIPIMIDITAPRTDHDSQDIFHDTHQIVTELLGPTQQYQNTLTLDHTATVPDKNNTVHIHMKLMLILIASQLLQTLIFLLFLQDKLNTTPMITRLLQCKMTLQL